MATRKMSEMSADASLDGTERLLAQGSDGSVVTTDVMAAYAVDKLHEADTIASVSDSDQAVIFNASDDEKIITIANLATWVVDTIEAVETSTPVASDTVLFRDDDVLKRTTIANLVAASTITLDVIDIDGGTDIGEALVDADEIIVDNGGGGTNRRCDVERLWTYVVTKIQGLGQKATAVDGDILTIQDSADDSTLKETTVAELWDNYLVGNLKAESDMSAASWVVDEDDMSSDSATTVPTQQSVKAYVDSQSLHSGLDSFTGEIDPANDQLLIDDGGGDTIERLTYQVFMDGIADLTEETIATGDSLAFIDSSSSDVARIETVDDLFEIGPALVTADDVNTSEDHMLFLDGSASGAANKCSIQSVFDDVRSITGGDNSLGITGQATTGEAGGAVAITGGTPETTENGGLVSIAGAASIAGATGNGGAVTLDGGDSGAINGTGGAVTATGGEGTGTAAGGAVTLTGGVAGATGNGGAITLTGGDSASGVGGTGGAVAIAGGANANTANGDGGAATFSGGAGKGTGDGGAVTISGGTQGATGDGGAVTVKGGIATTGGTGNTGAVTVESTSPYPTDGGDSGAITVQTAAGATHANAGGVGGAVAVTGGAGGATSGAGGTGGAGSSVTITAGDGGADSEGGSGTGGAGGSIALVPGSGGAGNTAGAVGRVTIADGKSMFIGPAATPGTTEGGNWLGFEDYGTAPAGTVSNGCIMYADAAGDDLDVLHADGTTDALLT